MKTKFVWQRERIDEAEKQKDSELHIAKTLYEEVNERLSQAIKDKNFNEAAIAQGLLEVAKQKLEHAVEQTKECSNKRVELDKRLLQASIYQKENWLNVEDICMMYI